MAILLMRCVAKTVVMITMFTTHREEPKAWFLC